MRLNSCLIHADTLLRYCAQLPLSIVINSFALCSQGFAVLCTINGIDEGDFSGLFEGGAGGKNRGFAGYTHSTHFQPIPLLVGVPY